ANRICVEGVAGEADMPTQRADDTPARALAASGTHEVFQMQVFANFTGFLRTAQPPAPYRCAHAEAAPTSRRRERIAAAPGPGVCRAAPSRGWRWYGALRGSRRAHHIRCRRTLRLRGGSYQLRDAGVGIRARRLEPAQSRAGERTRLRGGIMN